jgi:hypothetical protein
MTSLKKLYLDFFAVLNDYAEFVIVLNIIIIF